MTLRKIKKLQRAPSRHEKSLLAFRKVFVYKTVLFQKGVHKKIRHNTRIKCNANDAANSTFFRVKIAINRLFVIFETEYHVK